MSAGAKQSKAIKFLSLEEYEDSVEFRTLVLKYQKCGVNKETNQAIIEDIKRLIVKLGSESD